MIKYIMNRAQILTRLQEIRCALSPENLSMDGEASRDSVKRRAKALHAEEKKLHKLLERKTNEYFSLSINLDK